MKKTAWVAGITLLLSIIVLTWWSHPITPEAIDHSEMTSQSGTSASQDGQIPDVLFEFLSSQYGEYIAEQKGWKARESNSEPHFSRIYRVCLDQTQINEQNVWRYIAMCASPFDGEPVAHLESGLVDLFIWDESKKSTAASLIALTSGSFGQPGDVSLQKIGPQQFAFAIENGYTGQGYTVVNRRYYSAIADQIRLVADINLQRDNEGTLACDPSNNVAEPEMATEAPPTTETETDEPAADSPLTPPEACHIEKFTLQFDPQNEHFGFYDFIVTQQLQDGETHSERSETFVFDQKLQAYPIPEAFHQGW